MKKIFFAIFASLLFLFVSCASAPELSQMQLRSITTREYNANTKVLMKAALAVLQDHGYIVKATDSNVGLISAEKKADKSGIFSSSRSLIEASANITEIGKGKSKIRLTLQERKLHENRLFRFSSDDIVTIEDKAIYDVLFNDMAAEVQRMRFMK